uniref:Uncharacterized protein n=1 Tax=uncultured prokaryote TaxID=198431 RepID=A0A0H5Q6U3_9ZZZZ|nr:hypothetical protein [uncultured prokaryote]
MSFSPYFAGFAGLAGGLNLIYNVGRARDTRRFWADYYRNTGFKPMYPYRAGVYDWMNNDISAIYSIKKVMK